MVVGGVALRSGWVFARGWRGLGCAVRVGGVWRVGLGWSWWPRALVLLGLGSLGRSVVVVRAVGRSVGRAVRWLVVVGLFLVHVPHPDSYFLNVHARPWALTSLRCCDTEIDRHPHVVGWSGISADDAFPLLGAGHHSPASSFVIF